MTSPQYELNDLMELAEICSQARENSGLAAAAASPTNVGRESTYNIPIPPTNVGVPNPAHLTNTPAHVGELPNLFSSLGEILVPSVRAVNITDYGGGSQRPVSNGEGSLAATRVPRTSENFGVHYLGLNSDGVVPTTTARASGAAAPATLGAHPVWPNGTTTSALGSAARSPRVTEPDSDPFPVNTGTSAIGPDSFGGSNSGGKPADAANPVHFLASALQQHRGDRERVPRDDASRPEYPNPRPAREPRRTIATWTGQVGDQPPRVYASAAPWRDQMRVPSALALESVPRIFKRCTLQDFGAAQPGVVLATDPGAKCCEACGGLVVNLTRHEASRLHRDRVKAGTPRKDRSPHRDAAEVRARMARDPEFAALVLGPELPEPSAEAVDLGQEEALEVDLLEL
ncbi:hypothetical protein HPB49_005499 [Dermacentor silvarum]|uniref:Uncharacterized protein n=1 Tax=Dermacentor silvarum TaxID=543639 RepID=A0ACB8DVW6_DERSI|nr:hypothetical protein HPB49_005499 [Dermacentor silvarum]